MNIYLQHQKPVQQMSPQFLQKASDITASVLTLSNHYDKLPPSSVLTFDVAFGTLMKDENSKNRRKYFQHYIEALEALRHLASDPSPFEFYHEDIQLQIRKLNTIDNPELIYYLVYKGVNPHHLNLEPHLTSRDLVIHKNANIWWDPSSNKPNNYNHVNCVAPFHPVHADQPFEMIIISMRREDCSEQYPNAIFIRMDNINILVQCTEIGDVFDRSGLRVDVEYCNKHPQWEIKYIDIEDTWGDQARLDTTTHNIQCKDQDEFPLSTTTWKCDDPDDNNAPSILSQTVSGTPTSVLIRLYLFDTHCQHDVEYARAYTDPQ